MEHNPYTPPAARVEDQEDAVLAQVPRQVVWAARFPWITLALGLATSPFQRAFPELMRSNMVVPILIGVLGFMLGMTAWISTKLRAGRNWMRVLLLVLTVGEVGFQLLRLKTGVGNEHLIVRIQLLINDTLDIGTLVLVYTRPGADWFRRRPSRA